MRDHPEQPNAYVLSYVFRDQICEEKVTFSPRSTLFEQGFHLERDAKAVYPDLQTLVVRSRLCPACKPTCLNLLSTRL
jgi:hypothetical protein